MPSVDDDMYWAGQLNRQVGSNTPDEYENLLRLTNAGVAVRYMETNQNQKLLSHNKYAIFQFPDGKGAVFTGAGNFTRAAFTNNFENYYFITLPQVVEAYRQQYEYYFNTLATPHEKLPSRYVNP